MVNSSVIVLFIYCIVLTITLAICSVKAFLIGLVVLAAVSVVLLLSTKHIRKMIASVLHGRSGDGSNTEYNLETLNMPVAILMGKHIVWYNTCFKDVLLGKSDCYLESVHKLIPGIDIKKVTAGAGQSVKYKDRQFTVYGSGVKDENAMVVLYFAEDTELKLKAEEYRLSRPSVMHIMLDTYDELKKELKESERARISGEIDLALEKFVGKTTGFLLRTSSNKYVAVVEERHISQIINERFDILDKVRQIGGELGVTTLSIGVGRGCHTLAEGEAMAAAALEMALGRGGDQAAVKNDDGYTFFGGVSQSVEKRSKVKARIISAALCDLIKASDSVIIMGHRFSDMDSVGAAVGVLRICKACDIPACIAVNEKTTLALPLVKRLKENGLADDLMHPDSVLSSISENTLLVVVDTHLPSLLESEEVYRACKNVVVIDHHRKMPGHIDNAVIFYHEPYASSASELVSELLMYVMEKNSGFTPVEAEALLAGIMLDTREFAIHTGVRTFEAAAYLRRNGAQTVDTKKLFASDIEAYNHKASLVANALIYKKCAVAMADSLPDNMRVVIPQAANDLLNITDVAASFVAVNLNGVVSISARSMGEINVQVIMEKLGGGGHLTMAGAQLKNISMDAAKKFILSAIDEYWAVERKEDIK